MRSIFDDVDQTLNSPRRNASGGYLFRIVPMMIVVIFVIVMGGLLFNVVNPTSAIEAQAKRDAAYDRAYAHALREGGR